MAKYEYQTKTFVCKKCGITFTICADTTISDVEKCNECRNNIKK